MPNGPYLRVFATLSPCLAGSLNFTFLSGVKISAISWPLGKSTPLGKTEISVVTGAVTQLQGAGQWGCSDTEPSVLRPTVHLETKPLRGLWKGLALSGTVWMANANTMIHRLTKRPESRNTIVAQYKIPQYSFYVKWGLNGSWFVKIDGHAYRGFKLVSKHSGIVKRKTYKSLKINYLLKKEC